MRLLEFRNLSLSHVYFVMSIDSFSMVYQNMDNPRRTPGLSIHYPKRGISHGVSESGGSNVQCHQPDKDFIFRIMLLLCDGPTPIQNASDFSMLSHSLDACDRANCASICICLPLAGKFCEGNNRCLFVAW